MRFPKPTKSARRASNPSREVSGCACATPTDVCTSCTPDVLSQAFPKRQPRRQGGEKYGNVKTKFGKYLFDSKAEDGLYKYLLQLERQGIWRNVVVKPRVHMTLADILYIPDFGATECATGLFWHHEMKGFETDEGNRFYHA